MVRFAFYFCFYFIRIFFYHHVLILFHLISKATKLPISKQICQRIYRSRRKEAFIWTKLFPKQVSCTRCVNIRLLIILGRKLFWWWLMLKIFIVFCCCFCDSFPYRIRNFQLYFDFFEWFNFECSFNGNMWHIVCIACIRMWFKIVIWWKRCVERGFVFWHHLFVAYVGIFSGYKRTSQHHSTNIVCGLSLIMRSITSSEFLYFCCTTLSQRIFVSKILSFSFISDVVCIIMQ